MAFGVYAIFFPENYVYIGSTIDNLDKRFRVHRRALMDGIHDNDKMQELFNKYGEMRCEVLEEVKTKDGIRELEQYYINQLAETHNLCNELPATQEGDTIPEHVRQKISKGMRHGSRHRIKMGISDISQQDEPPPPPKGISDYHKRNYELRKEQGW